MNNTIDILKGIHPGLFLQRELRKHNLKSNLFAKRIGEYPQTISAIIRGHRSMNTALSLRIEHALGLDEGFLMTLQVYHDIAKEKEKLNKSTKPDTTKFRSALFWDSDLQQIDFQANRRYVINRIFERGNDTELSEIIRFYGRNTILENINSDSKSPFYNAVKQNLKIHLNHE